MAHAHRGAGIGRAGLEIVAFEGDGTGRNRMLSGDGAQQRRFADAVAAEHAGDAGLFGGDRDAAQRLGGAVMQMDIVDGQRSHDQRPR